MIKKLKEKFNPLYIFPILILISSIFMSIGYSALNSITLDIKGTAISNINKGIFISDITYLESGFTSSYDNEIINFTNTMFNSKIVLSNENSNSYITYKINIVNNSNDDYKFIGIMYDDNFYDNKTIIYELKELKENDIIQSKSQLECYITFKYNNINTITNNTLNSFLNLKFEINNITLSNKILSDNIISFNELDFNNSCPKILTTSSGEFSNINNNKIVTKPYIAYADNYIYNKDNNTYSLDDSVKICRYRSCYLSLINKYIVNIEGNTNSNNETYTNLDNIYLITSATSSRFTYKEIVKNYDYDYSCNGLYKISGNNYNDSYIYRGNISNNNLLLDINGNNLYFKIIRINEDNSIRLIFNGSNMEGGIIDNTLYSNTNDINFNNSNIISVLSTWYNNNIYNNYNNIINTNIGFCNDTSIYNTNILNSYNKSPFGELKYPNLSCNTNNIINSIPVGLISMDEYFLAGGYINNTPTNYLTIPSSWYTLTPAMYDKIFTITNNNITISDTTQTLGIRPVINLKSCVNWQSGNGTINDPYKINYNNSCQ